MNSLRGSTWKAAQMHDLGDGDGGMRMGVAQEVAAGWPRQRCHSPHAGAIRPADRSVKAAADPVTPMVFSARESHEHGSEEKPTQTLPMATRSATHAGSWYSASRQSSVS